MRVLASAFTLLALATTVVATAAPVEEVPAALRAAREKERVARLSLEAARSQEFYLIVDAGASTLSLGLGGVTLATYPLASAELGLPLLGGTKGAEGEPLQELFRCTGPELRPLREIVPGAPGPADSSERTPPRRVAVDCDPSLSLFLSSSGHGIFGGIRDRLRLPGETDARPRVRLLIAENEAETLFTSLPPTFLLLFSRVAGESPEATPPAPSR